MPELVGCCRLPAISAEDREGFDRLCEDVCRKPPVSSRSVTLPWAAIDAAGLHANDPAAVFCDDLYAGAWIGNGAPASPGEWSGICRAVHHDSADLIDRPPPFAACIVHIPSHSLYLVSDPFGLHPLYYAMVGDLLAFSSKPDPLLRSGLIPWSLDATALLEFFVYEHVLGHRTFADNMQLVPPGTILHFRRGRISRHVYWQLPDRDSDPTPADDLPGRLHEELRRSVASRIRSKSRVAVMLSGGLDSRALLGCALQAEGADVRTYTLGDPASRDARFAGELARVNGLHHTAVPVEAGAFERWLEHALHVTGGMVNGIHAHITALAQALAPEADVVLDGLGGDAITGGHLSRSMLRAESPDHASRLLQRRRATAWTENAARSSCFHADFLRNAPLTADDQQRACFADLGDRPPWFGCHRFDLRERQRRFIQYGPHLLRPYVHVETPFYSRALIGLMLSAPAAELYRQRAYLRMHLRYLPTQACVPDAAIGLPLTWPPLVRVAKRVVEALRRRLPRTGLSWTRPPPPPIDYSTWFRNELRGFVAERLFDTGSPLREFIRPVAIRRLLAEHQSGRADHSVRIGCLLTFDAWRRSLRPHSRRPQRQLATRPAAPQAVGSRL